MRLLRSTPYQYQWDTLDKIEEFNGRALLAHEMGLGKSIMALMRAGEHPEERPVIIVCPAFLKENWRRECSKHFGWTAEVLDGLRPPSTSLSKSGKEIWIANYDIIAPRQGKHGGKGWLEELQGIGAKLLILDEVHYLSDPKSHRSKVCYQLASGIPSALALTGTPMTNRPADLFWILHILRPDLYPSFYRYAWRYCAPERTIYGWNFKGASNLGELHERLLAEVMIRYRTEDVLGQIPPLARHVVPLPLSKEARAEYSLAEKAFLTWLAQHKPEKLRSAMRAEAIVKSGYVLRLAAKLKLPAVKDWVGEFLEGTDGKLILFGHQIEVVKELHDTWRKSSVLVNGSTKKQDRMKCVDQFNEDARTRLFIGNLKAAGSGWNAKACSDSAFCEFGWVPGDIDQAAKRTHGIGRGIEGRQSKAWMLVAEDTLEEAQCAVLQEKSKIIDQAIDGKVTDGALDVFDLFLNKARKRGL